MQPNSAPIRAPAECVVPDCCNTGVIFRTLLAVNGVVLAAVLLRSPNIGSGLIAFVEASILVELACLSSLAVLCGLRAHLRGLPIWVQRLTCGMVPAAITGLLLRFLLANDVYQVDGNRRFELEAILVAALFGFVLQHYFELRTRAFSPALAEARLQALQARIRPHFLFNSLNAVLSLIRTEPQRAETTLEDLADLFRVLMRDARDITTMEEEIHLCKQYLSIEKIRLGDRLQVDWDNGGISDDILRNAQIPSLLLQPLLENAVHYGVEPAREPVLIRIQLKRSMDRFDIIIINPVIDDASATAISPGNRLALDNIRQRLALLYDVEAELSTTLARGFFEVRLHFPYVKGPR